MRIREQVEVHHIRALKDLNPKGKKHPPEWVTRMAARHRKTLVVCVPATRTSTQDVLHADHGEHRTGQLLRKAGTAACMSRGWLC
jgi:hypothetical protein